MSALSTSPEQPVAVARRLVGSELRAGWWVAVVVGVCGTAASVLGLVWDGVYGSDSATAEMLRGFDAVTLLVVAPALVLALRGARHGSPFARLVMASLLLYLAYTYAYHLFGTGFNDLLLLHAMVFAGSLAGLVLTLVGLDAAVVAGRFSKRTPARAVATVLGLLAAALAVMWVSGCVVYALTGAVPAGSALVETDAVVHLGIVLDLTVLVPLYGVAAVLLWRREPWGFVLAAMALVSGVLHQLSYLAALVFQSVAQVPGAVAFDPVEPVIVLLYAGAATALLIGLRNPPEFGRVVTPG